MLNAPAAVTATNPDEPLLLVACTRLRENFFRRDTPLGRSLCQLPHQQLATRIHFTSHTSLTVAYNAAIDAAPPGAVLLFCDEQLELGPDPLAPQLLEALQRFDLVGVAGNLRDQPGQMAWWQNPHTGDWDYPFLSGAVQRRTAGAMDWLIYGPAPMPVQLLDGLFLAARAHTLHRTGLRFGGLAPGQDAALMFCRSAIRAGLRLGTWPLALPRSAGAAVRGDRPAAQHAQTASHRRGQLQLATAMHAQGRDREALALLSALVTCPDLPATSSLRTRALTNRGALLQLRGDLDAACRDHTEALRLEPGLRVAGDNLLALALQLRSRGRSLDALELLRVILRATPQRPDLLLQLGTTLMELGRVETAVPCFRRLLRQEPEHREAHYQLGQALGALGHTEAAIAALNTALNLDPCATEILACLEWHRLSLCDWDDHERRAALLLQRLETYAEAADTPLVPPLTACLFSVPAGLHRRLGERWSAPTSAAMAPQRLPAPPARPLGRRLRIGYLSADFRIHAMGTLLHGLFAKHDRRRFEVFAYSLTDQADALTAVIRSGVDHYAVVATESSETIARRIRDDGIDVLIDLMGHTHHSRPGVLAMRPAPLQLHYLGHPGSLGADWIDGVIADAWLIPPEHEIHHRETVHRLPWGFVSSGPPPAENTTAQVEISRKAQGLPGDAVVYACFNRPEKITPAVFADWLEILHAVPGSVLWILNEHHQVEERLRSRLMAAGLAPQRLIFSPKLDSAAFGRACALADLLLDTSPYGSGATAVTALAAGLPLLTCPGDSFASRMGASLCAATGLEELICPTPNAYRQRAIALGRQPTELARLRHHLLRGGTNLPLFDTAAWVGHLEALLEQLVSEVDTLHQSDQI